MWPTSVAIPVAVTTNCPVPRVAFVFMKTMSVRSPSGTSSPATVSTPFATGRLSPVSAASATSSVAACEQAPVRGDDVAGLDRDDVAGDELLGRELDQRAVAAHLRLDDHHLLQRGDGRCGLALLAQAEDGVQERQQDQDDAGAVLLERDDAADAGDEQDDLHRVAVLARRTRASAAPAVASANLFGPYRSRRAAASAAVSPCAGSTSSAAATSSAGRANHERSGVSAASDIASRDEARTRG